MSRVQRRDNSFKQQREVGVRQQRLEDLIYSGEIVTDAELSAHDATKTGVHGIPSMSNGQGLLWNGTDWVATDLATQVELDAVDTRIDEFDVIPSNAVFLARMQGAIGASVAAQSAWYTPGGSALASGTLSSIGPMGQLNWVASRWARTGKTTKWMIFGELYTNSTAVGTITYGIGWRRFTVGGAAGGISFSMIAGDTEAKHLDFVNPTGGASTPVFAELDVPADSNYAGYVTNNTTTATNTYVIMSANLYVYWE